MIVEHELIEQIQDEEHGRSLQWVCDLLRDLGRSDPFLILDRMIGAEYLVLLDGDGRKLPPWRCAEVLRLRDPSASIRVACTPEGLELVG